MNILPCPFCGSPAGAIETGHHGSNDWTVFCVICGAEQKHSITEEAAVKLWNRRANFRRFENDDATPER